MAKRIPTYINTASKQITEFAVDDTLDISINSTSVKADNYVEKVQEVGYVINGGASRTTLNIDQANNFTMNFNGYSQFNVIISGAPSGSDDAFGCTLIVDTAGMAALTWDSKIQWAGGVAPTLAADSNYVFTFLTTDNGTTFKGFVGGEAFA
jgi:hypothetical protein